MAQIKRKKKLINSALQLKMIGVFLGIAGTSALFQVVLLNKALLKLASEMPDAGDQLLQQLPGIMLKNVVLTMVVLVPLMFAVGLILTHRVAGPAYRMTQYCKSIARGEEMGPCRVRKDDELKDLCDALNAAVTRLRNDASAEDSSAVEAVDVDSVPGLTSSESDESVSVERREGAPEEAV